MFLNIFSKAEKWSQPTKCNKRHDRSNKVETTKEIEFNKADDVYLSFCSERVTTALDKDRK